VILAGLGRGENKANSGCRQQGKKVRKVRKVDSAGQVTTLPKLLYAVGPTLFSFKF
jgi:hypothetical protein